MDNAVTINARVSIPLSELNFEFVRASGPGGQHVNKTETAVAVWFDVTASGRLSEAEKELLRSKLANQLDSSGVLRIEAQSERSQLRNREEAVRKFAQVLRAALVRPKRRKKTKPTRGAIESRLNTKKTRSTVKQTRRRVVME